MTRPLTLAAHERQILHERFMALRAGLRQLLPNDWYLNQSDLTTLGYENIVAEVASWLETRRTPDRTPVALDWGGGPAFLTFLLEAQGLEAVYYDFKTDSPLTAEMLPRVKAPKHFVNDPTLLPFDDGSFDAVVSCGVLEHVADIPGSLAEIMRVLRPGGMLFIYHFPNYWSWTEIVAGWLGRAVHDVRYTRRRLRRELREAGFEVSWFEYRYLLPRNLVQYPRLRAFLARHAAGVYAFDRALARIPVLRIPANALNAGARKPSGV